MSWLLAFCAIRSSLRRCSLDPCARLHIGRASHHDVRRVGEGEDHEDTRDQQTHRHDLLERHMQRFPTLSFRRSPHRRYRPSDCLEVRCEEDGRQERP